MKLNTGIIVLMLLAMAVGMASAEDATSMYFVPSDGSCDCGYSGTVDLMINTSVNESVMQAHVHFDPTCINITDVSYAGSPWQPMAPPGWSNQGSYVIMGTDDFSGMTPPGVHKVATMTIECLCLAGPCVSPLNITDTITANVSIYNGTWTCNESQKDDEPCLGSCYSDINCTEIVAENISCCECVGEPGYRWQPNLDEACFGNNTPFDLCLDYCPECSDCEDNDGDTFEDYPMDPECSCGLDPSEREPLPPIPEAGTLILVGLGLAGLLMVCCIGSIRKKMK